MRAQVVIAIILLIVGVVWVGQGVGLIHGSFMTGEALWAVIGAIAILIALALLRGCARQHDTDR
jgi:hypothetical protein